MAVNLRKIFIRTEHDAFVWMIRSACNPKGAGDVWDVLSHWWERAFQNDSYPDEKFVWQWTLAIRYGLLLRGFSLVGSTPSPKFIDNYELAVNFLIEEYVEFHSLLAGDPYYNHVARQRVV